MENQSAIDEKMGKKVKFKSIKPGNKVENFLKAAMRLSPSNLLIARLTGIAPGTLSTHRQKFITKDPSILEARPFSIETAYDSFIHPLLQLADQMQEPVNHHGYYTLADLQKRAAKVSGAPVQVVTSLPATMKKIKEARESRKITSDVFNVMEHAKKLGAKEVIYDDITIKF